MITIDQFSPHLFWDVDQKKIDLVRNKRWIINRVLEYGLLKDWQLIDKYYGIDEIANVSMTLKDLDKTNLSFISALSGIPKEKFLCYSTTQSHPRHWNF